jgi:hypothetical protein
MIREIILNQDRRPDPPEPVVVQVDQISARWETRRSGLHVHTNISVIGSRTFQVVETLDAVNALIAAAQESDA